MAKKISQLTQATEVKSDDVTVIVQDGETKKLPLNMMVTKQDVENKKIAGLAKLDEIEATYENDTYTPTITVKNKSSVKTGEGDEVDYSANVMDGHVKSAILKGNTGYRDIDTGEFLETFEEGRNLELVSVKMPVLHSVGKNLFDGAVSKGYLADATGESVSQLGLHSTNYMKCSPNSIYTISGTLNNLTPRFYFYDSDKKYLGNDIGTNNYMTYTAPSNACYMRFRLYAQEQCDITLFNAIQVEEGSAATPFEPHKSNILTVNEDVTLRGIGKVKDELDLLTGEVTEHIGEIVLDGSEDWVADGNLYFIAINEKVLNSKATSNYLQRVGFVDFFGNSELIGVSCQDLGAHSRIYIRINANYSKEETIQYLQRNPLTVQYALATESVKTVDLMPSGTHPSTTPYCWKDGHIQLSSSGLLPSLEYSVVTSRAGQISQNAAMIVKNDKRIFDLEILLAGGLVNTTYQALTLQNQVETGLSKVSLSSEKEPDYLLYHMIMKLIEEKAYKLDDLTEKVSVFYLYEKLSDEQFETIYSALYPFVEDEIVEEPVVEELPEVVEDEVIM